MKLQLDTTNKVIKLESSINLGEFVKKIKKLLPEDWEKFTLETNTTITYWSDPIVIKHYPRQNWYDLPYVTYCNSSTGMTEMDAKGELEKHMLKEGIYNLEV